MIKAREHPSFDRANINHVNYVPFTYFESRIKVTDIIIRRGRGYCSIPLHLGCNLEVSFFRSWTKDWFGTLLIGKCSARKILYNVQDWKLVLW